MLLRYDVHQNGLDSRTPDGGTMWKHYASGPGCGRQGKQMGLNCVTDSRVWVGTGYSVPDSGSKWHHQQTTALLLSGIFWLHFLQWEEVVQFSFKAK